MARTSMKAAAAGERGAETGQRDPQGGLNFLRGRAGPATPLIVEFIRTHHGHREAGGLVWGVEPICSVLSQHGLPIAPSTYYDHLGRTPSRREIRDRQLEAEIARVHAAHDGVYGARKVWLQLHREGVEVARCTVQRLMRRLGLAGAVRGTVKRTTIADPARRLPQDLVRRRFAPLAPDRLWVADLTYVSTWSGWVYVAFVVDAYARRILGWRTGTTMTTQLVLDAVEQAIWTRARAGRTDLTGWSSMTTTGRNTCRWPTANGSPRPTSSPRSAPSAPPSTTRWPRRSTGSTRQS